MVGQSWRNGCKCVAEEINPIISYSIAVMLITALGTENAVERVFFSYVLNFNVLLHLEGIESKCFSNRSILKYRLSGSTT